MRCVFVFEKGDEEACNACSDFSVNEKPSSKIFLFKILGGRISLYGLEFKGLETDSQNRFLKLTDPHSTRLGIWIRPWVIESGKWVGSNGLMDSPNTRAFSKLKTAILGVVYTYHFKITTIGIFIIFLYSLY